MWPISPLPISPRPPVPQNPLGRAFVYGIYIRLDVLLERVRATPWTGAPSARRYLMIRSTLDSLFKRCSKPQKLLLLGKVCLGHCLWARHAPRARMQMHTVLHTRSSTPHHSPLRHGYQHRSTAINSRSTSTTPRPYAMCQRSTHGELLGSFDAMSFMAMLVLIVPAHVGMSRGVPS